MKCENCGSKLIPGQGYCMECGTKIPLFCKNCGSKLGEEDLFCVSCGMAVKQREDGEENNKQEENCFVEKGRVVSQVNTAEVFDHYRRILMEKSKIEKIMIGFTGSFTVLLSLVYFHNNVGEDRILETVIVACIAGGILFAIYGLIAGIIGVYEATRYLRKYDSIKKEVGKKEAVLYIEKEFNPKEKGKGMALGGIRLSGNFFCGCLQSIIGFSVSILVLIMIMSFC